MPESSVSADFGDDFRHAHILEDSAGAFLIKAQEPRAQLQRIPGGAHSGRPLFGTEHDAVERTRRAVGHGQPYGIRFADQCRQFRLLGRVIFQHVTKRTGKGLVTGKGSGGHSFSPGSGNIDRGIVFDFIDLKDEFKHCYQFCLSEGLEHP